MVWQEDRKEEPRRERTRPRYTMPFGKHRGEYVEDVPHDYLRWALQSVEWLPAYLREEMERVLLECAEKERENTHRWWSNRGYRHTVHEDYEPSGNGVGDSARSVVQMVEIIDKAYREACLRWHPDRGGSVEAMQAVNCLVARVKELLGGG
jgi:hypothetical protein